jgi:glycerol-3-phosphate dehydrogenase
VWNFIVYTSKDTIYGQRHPREQTSLRIVLEVAYNLLDKGQCLYPDNWNTSPKLVATSCTRKTEVVGTMRTNTRVSRLREKGQTTEGANSGSIPQETNDHEVVKQKKCRTLRHIS